MLCATKTFAPSDFQRMEVRAIVPAGPRQPKTSVWTSAFKRFAIKVWCCTWGTQRLPHCRGQRKEVPENLNVDRVTLWGLAEKRSQRLSWVGAVCKCHLISPTLLCCSTAAFWKGWFMFLFFSSLSLPLKKTFLCLFVCLFPSTRSFSKITVSWKQGICISEPSLRSCVIYENRRVCFRRNPIRSLSAS